MSVSAKGLQLKDCRIGMQIRVIGDNTVLTIVDLHPEEGLITYAFRDHRGIVQEHMMEPGLYEEVPRKPSIAIFLKR